MATLIELSENFTSVISSLKQKVTLKSGIGDDTVNEMLLTVESTLKDLEMQMALMKCELSRRTVALSQVQAMKKKVAMLGTRCAHMEENLPVTLPQNPSVEKASSGTPVARKTREQLTPMTDSVARGNWSPTEAPSHAQIKKKATTLFVPTIDYITVEEFDNVPKYIKGRMPYSQMNLSIDEFNKAIIGKYRLMATPRNKQSDITRNEIWDYKQQETKDTKGKWFIVDTDFKKFSALKLDSVGRSALTVLRHCNRMKEIRTKGVVRYSVVAL